MYVCMYVCITSKHAIACSWSADSRERRGVKNERENKGAGALGTG